MRHLRSASRTDHSVLDLLCQGVYQVDAGYEDCNDDDYLRIDPALRLATGKKDGFAASQPTLFRFENEILATDAGIKALEMGLSRSVATLLG